jgi:hypothetical protein
VSLQCRHHTILLTLCSEGTHAKYHYLICGVQGDFTKSLVNDPPRRIWTRELKVKRSKQFFPIRLPIIFFSLLVSLTRQPFTSVESVFALELVLVLLCLPASSLRTGTSFGSVRQFEYQVYAYH